MDWYLLYRTDGNATILLAPLHGREAAITSACAHLRQGHEVIELGRIGAPNEKILRAQIEALCRGGARG